MVIYDLVCDSDHAFEGWFKNASDLEQQQQDGLLSCPVCNSYAVNKKLTAAKVTKKSNSQNVVALANQSMASGNQHSPEQFAQLQRMLGQMHDYVESNFEDVGNRFSQEAISIQRGEKDPANIRGTANSEQLKQMADEGVQAMPLPPKPIDKKNLN